jgi:hypothetical protein
LAERHRVTSDDANIGEPRAPAAEELMANGEEAFADDREAGIGEEVMNVGNAPGERILDRQHRPFGLAVANGGKRRLECRAGKRIKGRRESLAGEMRIRAGLALKGDLLFRLWRVAHPNLSSLAKRRTYRRRRPERKRLRVPFAARKGRAV